MLEFLKKPSLNFYGMLIAHTQATRDAVDQLCVYFANPTVENGIMVKTKERGADQARHRLIDEINATFVTPIDREDLFRLSSAIDDLADYAATTVKDMDIYDIKPDKNLLDMALMLRDMADGLLLSVTNLEKNKDLAAAEATKVKKKENAINTRFHQSFANLFESDDIKMILKYREIYNHMNHASDKGDLAADMLLDIIVKL